MNTETNGQTDIDTRTDTDRAHDNDRTADILRTFILISGQLVTWPEYMSVMPVYEVNFEISSLNQRFSVN